MCMCTWCTYRNHSIAKTRERQHLLEEYIRITADRREAYEWRANAAWTSIIHRPYFLARVHDDLHDRWWNQNIRWDMYTRCFNFIANTLAQLLSFSICVVLQCRLPEKKILQDRDESAVPAPYTNRYRRNTHSFTHTKTHFLLRNCATKARIFLGTPKDGHLPRWLAGFHQTLQRLYLDVMEKRKLDTMSTSERAQSPQEIPTHVHHKRLESQLHQNSAQMKAVLWTAVLASQVWSMM